MPRNWTRRTWCKAAIGMPLAAGFRNFEALAAPFAKQVKITAVKTLLLSSVTDACLVRIDTDAGLSGYGESGLPAAVARDHIRMLAADLIGKDPLPIQHHFYRLAGAQYSFMADIPAVSGIDMALWDLAGKIMGQPVYRLLGGPFREAIPVYSHAQQIKNLLDPAQCREWAAVAMQGPEGFTTYKFFLGVADFRPGADPFTRTLDGADLRKIAAAYANIRAAAGDKIDIAAHCHGQFDTPSAIGLCRAIEPASPRWIEDPLPVRYSEAWAHLRRETKAPLLAGEKTELIQGFRPFLDNGVLDVIHPDLSYAGGSRALGRSPITRSCRARPSRFIVASAR